MSHNHANHINELIIGEYHKSKKNNKKETYEMSSYNFY